MKASNLSFRAVVLLIVAGMIWGIKMAISDDHSARPAHAHLNIPGWYRYFFSAFSTHLYPGLDRGWFAIAQVWVWIVAVIVMSIRVGLVHTGHRSTIR